MLVNPNPHSQLALQRSNAQSHVLSMIERNARGFTSVIDIGAGAGGVFRAMKYHNDHPSTKITGYHAMAPVVHPADVVRVSRIPKTPATDGKMKWSTTDPWLVGCHHKSSECPCRGRSIAARGIGKTIGYNYVAVHSFYYLKNEDLQTFVNGDQLYVVYHDFTGDGGSFCKEFEWKVESDEIIMTPLGPCGNTYKHRDTTHLMRGFRFTVNGKTLYAHGGESWCCGAGNETRIAQFVISADELGSNYPHIDEPRAKTVQIVAQTTNITAQPTWVDESRSMVTSCVSLVSYNLTRKQTVERLVQICSSVSKQFKRPVSEVVPVVRDAFTETRDATLGLVRTAHEDDNFKRALDTAFETYAPEAYERPQFSRVTAILLTTIILIFSILALVGFQAGASITIQAIPILVVTFASLSLANGFKNHNKPSEEEKQAMMQQEENDKKLERALKLALA